MADVELNHISPTVQDEGDKKPLNNANEEEVIAPLIASLKDALTHGKAKKVYLSKKDDPTTYDTCDCCNLPIEGKLIPLTCSLKKLYHLGSGFALYFRFIKSAIQLLLIVFFISGLYNIISSVRAGDCLEEDSAEKSSVKCTKGYILTYTIANKMDSVKSLEITQILNLVSVVVIMIYFHRIRYKFRKTEIQADDETITPSDYTCVFENVDPETKEGEFRKWVLELGKKSGQEIKIARITKSYAITQYIKLRNRERELSKKYNSLVKKKSKSPKELEQLQQTQSFLLGAQSQLKDVKSTGIKRATYMYVTFATANDSDFIQKQFHKSILGSIMEFFRPSFINTARDFKGRKIHAERAPEPTDILWENLGYTTKEKYTSRTITNLLTFIFICISFGIILGVNWGQQEAKEVYGETSSVVQGISIVVSLVIAVTNAILAILIDFLTKFERHTTYTNYLKGVAQKLSIAQFLNTALVSLIVELILGEDDGSGKSRLERINFYTSGGLLENMFWIFITSAFLPPIMTMIDPGFMFKRFKQWLAVRAAKDLKMSQADANVLFEGPIIPMPTKYAGMIKVILLTTFYAPALPLSLIITIGGLTIYYWAEKYVLLRRTALPNSIGDDLADEMIEYAEWAACTFAVGNIIFIYTLKNTGGELAHSYASFVIAWVIFGISLIHIFFPMDLVNQKLFPIEDLVTENKTYYEVRHEFNTDYAVENPITHRKAFKELQAIKKKFEKGIKSEGAKDIGEQTPKRKPSDKNPEKVEKGEKDENDKNVEDVEEPEVEEVEEPEEGEEEEWYDDEEVDFDDLDNYADQSRDDMGVSAQTGSPKLKEKDAYVHTEEEPLRMHTNNGPVDLIRLATVNLAQSATLKKDYEKQDSRQRSYEDEEEAEPVANDHEKNPSNQYDQEMGTQQFDANPSSQAELMGAAHRATGSKQLSIVDQSRERLGFGVHPDDPMTSMIPNKTIEDRTPKGINDFSQQSEE